MHQSELDLALRSVSSPAQRVSATSLLESDAFPIAAISTVAEQESWRKEVYRPIYHMHKWWAQRLGSVFRAIVIGAFHDESEDLMSLFYSPVNLNGAVVLDPFMGSGTTPGEVLKLRGRAIGRDINPVAYFSVRNALQYHNIEEVLKQFDLLEKKVAKKLKGYYQATMADGSKADVLYYFWVKQASCPVCTEAVDLFSSRIFARHATPKSHPAAQATCPNCQAVHEVRFDDTDVGCIACGHKYDPGIGAVKGQKATCSKGHTFSILASVRASKVAPKHRMYAKLVLKEGNEKAYLPCTLEDRTLFEQAVADLKKSRLLRPVGTIEQGCNTDQVINYNYRNWSDMFNSRQMLCLGLLAREIRKIKSPYLRDVFACLFSGTLEFNNMFASYKGEGTGAVRHMFSHHILKPERTPLEANPWGTPKSSGAFSTLFKTRVIRALEYAANPFEIRVDASGPKSKAIKVAGMNAAIGAVAADSYKEFEASGSSLYLSCGSSSTTDIADKSVDVVVTDPPFFDNVNYSELADFFYAWQGALGIDGKGDGISTRSALEVQHADAAEFTARITAVWIECHRVLKDGGLMAFTYHHSKPEGWSSLLASLASAGFSITASQPIKAEMSVASPKKAAAEPIDLDVVIVCRKIGVLMPVSPETIESALAAAGRTAHAQVMKFRDAGRRLSQNDLKVILMGQRMRFLSSMGVAAAPCMEARLDESIAALA